MEVISGSVFLSSVLHNRKAVTAVMNLLCCARRWAGRDTFKPGRDIIPRLGKKASTEGNGPVDG